MIAVAEDDKVLQNKVRRMAARQGLRVLKSRRRDPKAADYGTYSLVQERRGIKPTGPTGFFANLDEVYAALNWKPKSESDTDVKNGEENQA